MVRHIEKLHRHTGNCTTEAHWPPICRAAREQHHGRKAKSTSIPSKSALIAPPPRMPASPCGTTSRPARQLHIAPNIRGRDRCRRGGVMDQLTIMNRAQPLGLARSGVAGLHEKPVVGEFEETNGVRSNSRTIGGGQMMRSMGDAQGNFDAIISDGDTCRSSSLRMRWYASQADFPPSATSTRLSDFPPLRAPTARQGVATRLPTTASHTTRSMPATRKRAAGATCSCRNSRTRP